LPLALLVDEKTASAAEIFVAALQDHHRAIVIGKKTLGKAVVQTIFNLKPARNALCITTAKYFPPDKYDFHQKGLTPDITLEKDSLPLLNDTHQQNMKSYLSPENPALKVAVNILH
jgi:carboxyl-terminal processing protease